MDVTQRQTEMKGKKRLTPWSKMMIWNHTNWSQLAGSATARSLGTRGERRVFLNVLRSEDSNVCLVKVPRG